MTYLELVNSVLRKLREDTVSTVSENTLSTLVGDFANTIKKEVEDSWKWNSLRYTTTVSTTSGTFRYILTGAGDTPVLNDAWNDTNNSLVNKADMVYLNSLFTSSTTNGTPSLYGVNGVDSTGDIQVDLYPIPDGVYSIDFNMILNQNDLSADGDVILTPAKVIELGTWALAISERGEDGGASFNEIDARYRNSLADAISIDAGNMHSNEVTWSVV